MTGTLKVSTGELRSTSTQFDNDRAQIKGLMDQMNNVINGLGSTWQGEAQQAYVNSFKGLQNDINLLDRKIKEHVTDLMEMAQVYDTAERETQEASTALPKNVIS